MRCIPFLLFSITSALVASDVTTYRGIDGSGTFDESGLLRSWPKDGPKKLWSAPTAHGWANVSVVGDKVYIIGGQNAQLHIFALEDGRLLDKIMMGPAIWKRWTGSRTVPIIANGMAVGGMPSGQLVGVDLATKLVKWDINAWKSFGSGKGHQGWGWPESPSLHKNLVIFSACSRDLETPPLVAVDIRTGKPVWQMAQETPSASKPFLRYSAADVSGVTFSHRGRPMVVYPTLNFLVALDADTGKKLWEIPKSGGSVLPPIYIRDRGWLLVNLSFDTPEKKNVSALTLLELSPDGSSYTIRWRRPGANTGWNYAAVSGDRVFTHGMDGSLVYDAQGNIIIDENSKIKSPGDKSSSIAGTTDIYARTGCLLCLDLLTGRLLDSLDANFPNGAHIVSAEGCIYAQDAAPNSPKTEKNDPQQTQDKGPPLRIRLISPTATGMKVVGTLNIPLKTAEDLGGSSPGDVNWYAAISPVISHGRLFVRYGGLHVFDLRAEQVFTGTRGDGSGVIQSASAAIPASRTINLRWTAEAAGGEVVAKSTALYHLDPSGVVTARDSVTGTELWRSKSLGKAGVGTGLILRSDTGFALAAGRLRQFALKDGLERWNVACDGAFAPITIHDVVVVQGKDALTAFAVSDGKECWKSAGAGAAPVKLRCDGTPFLATIDGRLLSIHDGTAILSGLPTGTAHVGIGAKRYAAGEGKITCAEIRNNDGAFSAHTLWTVQIPPQAGQPVVHEGRLYACIGNTLKVYDALTGTERGSLALTAAPTAAPLIAAGHLWLPGAGGAENSLVVTLGDTPKIVWNYSTQGEIAAPIFLTDGYALRAGGRLHALLGPSPVEPSPVSIITTSERERPSDLKPFANDTMPTDWLFAGPIPKKDPDLDHLASIGGRQKAAIVKGLSFEVDGATYTFASPSATSIGPAQYAGDRPVIELTVTHSKQWNTTGYYAATIDNEQERFVRYSILTPGTKPWIARLDTRSFLNGVAIDETQPIRLGVGRHKLLVVAGMGQAEDWGKIFMLPRFIDDTDAVSKLLERDKRQQADWKQYQKEEFGKLFVLPSAYIPTP